MIDKRLKKLSRKELLEMLIAQTNENEALRAELKQVREQLEDKKLQIRESGSIAEAALRLNGVFEAADAAVRQYLDNSVKNISSGSVKPQMRRNVTAAEGRKPISADVKPQPSPDVPTAEKKKPVSADVKPQARPIVPAAEEKKTVSFEEKPKIEAEDKPEKSVPETEKSWAQTWYELSSTMSLDLEKLKEEL